MESSSATLENSLLTQLPKGIHPKEAKIYVYTERYAYIHMIYSSFTQNSTKLETTQMNKQAVVYLSFGILLSNKKEYC
jgi:hypothetical protein